MATKVGEFFIDLAIDAASGNLSVKQLVGALGELDVASVTSVGIFSKVADTLWNLAKAATGTAVELSALKEVTGADPKIVQQWEKAAERIGIQSGSIIRSIQGVNKMMGGVASGTAQMPMEFGRLGITPQKGVDDKGRPVMKDFFDIFKELANPKSAYWKESAQVQQKLLGGMPFSNPEDIFRLLNQAKAGKFKPEDISVLEDKQVGDLNAVRQEETKISQQMVGIFDKLILGGDAFHRVLVSISGKLESIDKWISSKQGTQTLQVLGGSATDLIRANFNPYTLGKNYGIEAGKQLFGSPVATPRIDSKIPQLNDLQGKLDINITGQGGLPLGQKEIFLKRKVGNIDVEHITINAGNGGH